MRRDETLEAYIAYDHTWNNKHSFGAMVGYSWQHFYHESNNLSIAPDQSKTYNDTHNKFEHYLVSFFGRLNYSYDNRYLITATLRADGTSRFDNNRWGLFPSVALAWNVKNEHFLKNVDAVSALKLRLSYGQTGQQDVAGDSYPSIGTYYTATQGGWYKFGDEIIKPIMPREYNTDLKWETTTTYNIGLDFGFLNNRLTFSVDGYWRKTKDLLNYTPVAAGSNLKNFLNANIGTLENKGVELDINYVAIQTRDWYWQIGVNGAYNQNKITKLTSNDADESYRGVDTGGIAGGTGNTIQKYMTGYPAPTFYVYKQVYDTDGQPIMGAYEDLNNDGKIDEGDKYYCKQAAPKFTIGLNTTLCYKNWTLAISAHSNLGNYVYDNNLARLSLITDLWTNNFVANRTPQGVKDGFTKVQYHSDYYIRNASFFKLDNITLGYDFQLPKDMKLNLFATVQNVCVATRYSGVDPEVFNGIDSNLWPRPRTYMIGLKFNF